MKRTLAITIVALTAGLWPTLAFGELITFFYSGELTLEADRDGVLNGQLDIGETTTFAGTYTFESTTPDSRPDLPEFGLYGGAITDITGHVLGSSGPVLFSGPPDQVPDGPISYIVVGDNDFSGDSDHYTVFNIFVRLLDVALGFDLSLKDFSGTALDDDLLPLEPPSLELFDLADFLLMTQDDDQLRLRGDVHELRLVPEPATAWLLALAVTAAARRFRVGPRIVGVSRRRTTPIRFEPFA